MDTYLMMLYVSLEQEEAVKEFFTGKGWPFQKPDLSVLTDRTGPLVIQETTVNEKMSDELGVPKVTVEPAETVIEALAVPVSQSETAVKITVVPKRQKKKGKYNISNTSNNREYQEILQEAELISASVSQNKTVGGEGAATAVKNEYDNKCFTTEQNDDYDDTYDDYDDYHEQETEQIEPSVSKTGYHGNSSMQSSSVGQLRIARKRKLTEKSKASEKWADGDTEETPIKATQSKKKRLQYNRTNIQKAFEATKKGMSVYRAAGNFNIPESTLRDRTCGKVVLDAKPGFCNLFSEAEELKLVEHIKYMNDIGKGYNAVNIKRLAKEYALSLGKDVKSTEHMSSNWYYRFIRRWPDITIAVGKTKQLNTPHEETDAYYKRLGAFLNRH